MNLNTEPSTSPHFMTQDMWQNVIAPEAMRQCDQYDGVRRLCARTQHKTPVLTPCTLFSFKTESSTTHGRAGECSFFLMRVRLSVTLTFC